MLAGLLRKRALRYHTCSRHVYLIVCLYLTYISGYVYEYKYIYIYIYIYINTYIHTCIHTYIHTYIHTCIHVYMYICVYIYIICYTYMYIYINIFVLYMLHNTYTYIHTLIERVTSTISWTRRSLMTFGGRHCDPHDWMPQFLRQAS